MPSFMARLEKAETEADAMERDPLHAMVERCVRGMEAISTTAILELVGLPVTTGNARRVSKSMQALGYVPMKSRRFMPGGWRDTVTRGWALPMRRSRNFPRVTELCSAGRQL